MQAAKGHLQTAKTDVSGISADKNGISTDRKAENPIIYRFSADRNGDRGGEGAINLYQEPAWRPLPNRIEISAKFKRGRPEILKPLQSSAALDAEKGRTWAAIHATAPLKMQVYRDNLPKSAQIGNL